MSVFASIQKLFKPKSVHPEDSMDMASVGMPGDPLGSTVGGAASLNAATMRQMDGNLDAFAPSRVATIEEEGVSVESADLLSLPLLGRRTIGQHQRILVGLLALAVVVLGTVTFLALNQADKVAQQVAATGQSLMQSQRLAKSVSQALVGSAQAFPDVRESSDVLAKTVRGLKSGEESLRLAPVAEALQPDVEKVTPFMERAEKNAKTRSEERRVGKECRL